MGVLLLVPPPPFTSVVNSAKICFILVFGLGGGFRVCNDWIVANILAFPTLVVPKTVVEVYVLFLGAQNWQCQSLLN